MSQDMKAFYCRPLDQVANDLLAAGVQGGYAAALAGAMAGQVAFGCLSDEAAHALGSQTVVRVEAPPSDPNNPEATDPSPNQLDPNVPVTGP